MVRFEKDKLVIEIKTTSPRETWMEIHSSLCDIVRFVRQDTICDDSFHIAIDLLSEMMPDCEVFRKME